jgi:hypothetical protein
MTPGSDIDLLVVERAVADARGERVKIRRTPGGIGFPIHVIVISPEWFEESKELFGGIACPAHMCGRVLFEAA